MVIILRPVTVMNENILKLLVPLLTTGAGCGAGRGGAGYGAGSRGGAGCGAGMGVLFVEVVGVVLVVELVWVCCLWKW